LIPHFWFILRETCGDVILAKPVKKLRKTHRPVYAKSELDRDNVLHMLKVSIARPTKMLLTETVVIFFTL
jgi:hypothetical protein